MPKPLDARLLLGRLVATPAVLGAIDGGSIKAALSRHSRCDWGDVCDSDWQMNNQAATHGERILSAYHDAEETKFWIITEADRSYTTVLLPSDY